MIVALAAVGALLVSVVLVVPAATVRLVARDLRTLQLGTGALAAVEGVAALWARRHAQRRARAGDGGASAASSSRVVAVLVRGRG